MDYFIPTACPSDKNLECACTEDDNLEENKAMLVELEEDDIQIAQSTSKKMKKGKRPLAVVDSNLRRSPRIKQVSNGFKNSVYTNRRCLVCSPNPPIIPTQVIRALGAEFCQLDEDSLTDEILMKGGKMKSPVGKKKGSKKKAGNEGESKNSSNKDEAPEREEDADA